jgi:hypothetical protein
MQHALMLSKAGKLEESLREYLALYDNSRSAPSLVGVRFSFLLSEIVTLGRKYHQALRALEARRDAAERLALAGRAASFDLLELHSLNQHLGESHRTLGLYDRLRSSGRSIDALSKLLCTEFLHAKRRQDFVAVENDCLRRLAAGFSELERNIDFPERSERSANAMSLIRFAKEHRAIPIYAALLAFGRLETAAKLKKWLLRPQPDESTYVRLIEAAITSKKLELARSLADEARKQLPASEMTAIDEIVKTKLTP